MRGTAARMDARLPNGQPFLWIDEAADWASRLQHGDILLAPVAGHGTSRGEWTDSRLGRRDLYFQRYLQRSLKLGPRIGPYQDTYKPVVFKDSRSFYSGAGDDEFTMVWHRHVLFVNAAMHGRNRARDVMIDSHHRYTVTDATNVQQIEHYGRPGEQHLAPDTGAGFIWRIHSISGQSQTDGARPPGATY